MTQSEHTRQPLRLGTQPNEEINRAKRVTFTWNGKTYTGYEGDTIVSALYAAGERVFSRSMKFHSPRGVLTGSMHDPGTIMQVDDEPNVRGAHRQIEDGMQVSSQNTWPSLKYDVRSVNELGARFLGPGFYYKTFMKPDFLRPLYQRVLRGFVHGGVVAENRPAEVFEKRYAHTDVLVAGGGPAGMEAPLNAAQHAPPSCWSKRNTNWVGICAGLTAHWLGPCAPRWRPIPISPCTPTRPWQPATTTTGWQWCNAHRDPAWPNALSKLVLAASWWRPGSLNGPMCLKATTYRA